MPGVVAAGDRETALAAREILNKDGNAVDAVIAAAAASFLAEPLLASAGGSGIMTVALPDKEPTAIDFFSDMPGLGGTPDELHFSSVQLDFGPVTQDFHIGRGAAAVPGALAGLAEAHRRFGSLALDELMAPAVRLATEGVTMTPSALRVCELLRPILMQDPVAMEMIGGSTQPRLGDRVVNLELAQVLREFAALGRTPDRVLESMLEHFGPEHGGLVTEADVKNYRPTVTAPRLETHGDWTVYSSPAPGGRLAMVLFHELAGAEPTGDEATEIVRYARASRSSHAQRRNLLAPGSTTHISVVDTQGGAASVTLTNGEGCGYLIPGTGIQLNNFLGEEDINPDGFHRHQPGKRLPTMIAPAVGVHNGVPSLALGSGGSNRIRSAVGSVMYRAAVLEQPIHEAVRAPRAHAEDDTVWVELEGLRNPDAAIAALATEFARVHPFAKRDFFFGGVHAVILGPSGPSGVGDERRGGVAMVSL